MARSSGQTGGAFRSRRSGRRYCTAASAAAFRRIEDELLCREQTWRGRQHWRRSGRTLRPRRLHRIDHVKHDHDQPAAVQERAL